MRFQRHVLHLVLVTGVLLCASTMASAAESSADAYAQGQALMASGDFDAALKAFAQAAKSDLDNTDYRDQFAVVRRVVKMRQRVDKEQNPEKWQATVQALRGFYYENKLFGEALDLDRKAHARLNTPDSATALAETMLQMGQDSEAAEVLAGVPSDQLSLDARALHGIALARTGRTADAKAVAEQCSASKDTGPGVCFDLARLQAQLGNEPQAMALLTQAFEGTLPSRLEAFKAYAKNCPDFGKLVASADFKQVLATRSKVKESGCSSGTSCGKCPSRGKCSKSSSSTKP